MCGISGIVNYAQGMLDVSTAIQKMTNSLKHRGPDGEGYFFKNAQEQVCAFGNDTPKELINAGYAYAPTQSVFSSLSNAQLAFGHRRLSIIDLSAAGHQPMCNKNKKNWITYNGEIYNYIELRNELISIGYSFETGTDTEVILAAYEAWGMDCVNKFNGMWAFVIYDTTQNKLVGSRDRFGVKPFYYIHTKEVFSFASEQKALLAADLIKPQLNQAALFDYFVFSKIENEEEGMFAGIFELQQAHNFEFFIADKKLNKWKYYTLPYLNSFETFNEIRSQELTQKTKELIFESVRLRLRSDVAVGSCLSGGIDSSSIVSIMDTLLKENPSKINLFTASFSNPKLDEGKWAKLIVDHTNSDWSRCYPSGEELKNDLLNLTYSQDLPIWSTSTYAQYRVMQLAKEKGVKVILDGQGGDELWAGYPHHQALFLRELIANKNWKEAQKLLSNAGNFPSNTLWFGKQYFKHSGLAKLPDSIIPLVYKNYFKHLQFLNPDFINAHNERFKTHFESAPNTVNELLYKETTAGLLKGYLKCEDRCSMWHSVESRTPFADDKNLIELAFQTPAVYKIHGNQSKYILRKAMTDIVPASILSRQDKMGYSTPNAQWMNEIKESVRSDFNDSLAQILDVKKFQTNYNKIFSSHMEEDNGQTFKFISFALWHKIFKL